MLSSRISKKDGSWHSTNSLNADKLFTAAYVALKSFDKVSKLRGQQSAETSRSAAAGPHTCFFTSVREPFTRGHMQRFDRRRYLNRWLRSFTSVTRIRISPHFPTEQSRGKIHHDDTIHSLRQKEASIQIDFEGLVTPAQLSNSASELPARFCRISLFRVDQ